MTRVMMTFDSDGVLITIRIINIKKSIALKRSFSEGFPIFTVYSFSKVHPHLGKNMLCYRWGELFDVDCKVSFQT